MTLSDNRLRICLLIILIIIIYCGYLSVIRKHDSIPKPESDVICGYKVDSILKMKRPKYLKKLKNPCWEEELDVSQNPYRHNHFLDNFWPRVTGIGLHNRADKLYTGWERQQVHPKTRYRCLPYFYLAGVSKCGTTDLWSKLTEHPEFASNPGKEFQWWSRFSKGDGTPTELADNDLWWRVQENKNPDEPTFLTPHFIYHLTPNARVIVTLRNPVDRLYSNYLAVKGIKGRSPEQFHKMVVKGLEEILKCLKQKAEKGCLYGAEFYSMEYMITRGCYSVYIKDWLHVFPRNQIHIHRLEDYSRNKTGILKELHAFLGLKLLTNKQYDVIVEGKTRNSRTTKRRSVGEMLPSTRTLLNHFYKPYNSKLSELLQDKRFMWIDKESGQLPDR